MEPNKLENQIREKLNSREIQPSAQAWDRLDAMLSVSEEKETRRPFGFLFIAASILVLLTVGLFFFTQNGAKIQPKNDVVGTEIKKDTVQKEENNLYTPIVEKNQENQTVVSAESENQKSQNINHNQRVSNNQSNQINQKQSGNSNINYNKEIQHQNTSDVALKDMPRIMDTKEIIVGKKEISIKTDENLLADLDKAAKQSTNKKSVVKIDAKDLLSQVDGELEMTFREKVINKVNKNYREVKVALANRNQE